MYLTIKIAALAAHLFVPPSPEQVEQFIAKHMPQAPVVEMQLADNDAQAVANDDFSYLPPWETSDEADPPLPQEAELPVAPATEEAIVAVGEEAIEEEAIADDSGLVDPMPAYWVEGTDEPDADEVATDDVADASDAYLDGTDDDVATDDVATEEDESYIDGYTEEYYRELEEAYAKQQADAAATEELAETDESLDNEWYDEADAAAEPYGPVAEEYSDEYADESYDEEASLNEYEYYEELAVDETSEEADSDAVATAEENAVEEDAVDDYSAEDYSYEEDYASEDYADEDYSDEYYGEGYDNYEAIEEEVASDVEPTEAVEEEYTDEDYSDEYYEDEYYSDEYYGEEYGSDEAIEEEASDVEPTEAVGEEYTEEDYSDEYYDDYSKDYAEDYYRGDDESATVEETEEAVDATDNSELAGVIANWENLSEVTRSTILSLVEQDMMNLQHDND